MHDRLDLVRCRSGMTTWKKLKTFLMSQFKTKTSSAAIHKILRETKKKAEESEGTCFLRMEEFAHRGNVDRESLFTYVIDGLPGDVTDKMMLLDAKTLREFREVTNL